MELEKRTRKNVLILATELWARGLHVQALAFIFLPWQRPELVKLLTNS